MVSPSLRRAWQFFHSQTQSAVTAWSLAKAEQAAREEGLTFNWEDDVDGWQDLRADGFKCSCGCGATINTCEGCVCRSESGEVLASLWAIWDASDDYRRVVEAELASDALAGLLVEVEAIPSL